MWTVRLDCERGAVRACNGVCTELGLQRGAAVFIEPSAPASEALRIGDLLEAAEVFSSMTFVDQEQGFVEFQERFDLPAGIVSVDNAAPYWELELPMGEDVTALFDDLDRDPAVFSTVASGLCRGVS